MRVLRPAIFTVFGLLFFLILASPSSAQGFGKNKVQYESLDWSVLETPHVRLHYYAEEESLARRLAVFAESVCVEYDARFHLEQRHQVPVLLYATHHLFQQTNATPELLTEATGGLTELIKGRVLIPHNGSWARLRWVTRHEFTHWYMLEKVTRVQREHRRAQGYLPPLWFIEGLAEYCGTTWDPEAEGLLRDAVLSGEARPLTKSDDITGTVLMYKEGQSFLLYLAEKYGADKVVGMFDNWYRTDNFETVFRLTVGVPLKKVDEEWFESLRRRYYPVVAVARPVNEVGRRLTPKGRFNLGPRVLHAADPADTTLRFCYFAASESGIDLTLSEPRPKGRRATRRLLRGGLSAQFESFHLFQNRPGTSNSGLIAVSSKRGGRDALYLLDSVRRRVVRRLDFPQLVAMNDPAIVPGDTALVFSAQDYGGRSDLYRASWGQGPVRLQRLTNDDFDDLEPDVSPDGQWVVFASDRADRAGRYSLFRLSLAGGSPELVSAPPSGDDRQPVYSPDGRWLAFRSTRGGTSDLYVRPSEPSREVRRVTQLQGPVSDPDWLSNNRGLLFTAQSAITFQTYEVMFQPESLAVEHEAETPATTPLARTFYDGPALRYERRLGFDLVQNALAVDPSLGGAGGGGQVAISDVLGNEQIFLSLSNSSDRFGNFWDGFEGSATYINQARRLNYGVGFFRLTQVYDADLNAIRLEKRVGLTALASYPFNKFSRLEGSLLVRHANNHLLRSGDFQDVDLVSNFLSFVHDDVGWSYLGASMGTRFILAAGFTRDLTSSAGDYGTLLGEVRRYWRPIPQLVWASRVQGQASLGRDAQRFYLGGRSTLRGYDPRTLAGLRTAVVQQEFRFPLLRGLTVALPTPWQFPPVSGVAFADAAWAWDGGNVSLADVPAYYFDQNRVGPGGQGHLGSAGVGFYIGGGYYPTLRWNYVWQTPDFNNFSRRPRTQFSFGYNF
jgi:Tol biopolymer transport system component